MTNKTTTKPYSSMAVKLELKEYSSKETVSVMESVLFTKLSEQSIRKSGINSIKEPIAFIEYDWKLSMSRTHDFKVIKRILINSVKKN
jgi:hypothetical protein